MPPHFLRVSSATLTEGNISHPSQEHVAGWEAKILPIKGTGLGSAG